MDQALQAHPQSRMPGPPEADAPAPMFDLIELFFFAYRDFVGDADRLLEDFGFGRAHHRVLHFVNRQPGLMIAELLDILGITKQSLNRVLKELLDTGYVEARPGVIAANACCSPRRRAAVWRWICPTCKAGVSSARWENCRKVPKVRRLIFCWL